MLLGTAFTKADAVALGYTNFSAPELIETTAGDYYLMVTPVASTPRAGYYSGCWGYRLDDIDAATTVAAPASPDLVISGLTDTFHGACGYHSATRKSGILLSQLEEDETDLFRIVATGRNF